MSRYKKYLKLDGFNLLRAETDLSLWKVDGRDLNGSRKGVRFMAASDTEAIAKAEQILKRPRHKDEFPVIIIEQAFVDAARGRDWTVKSAEDDMRTICYFLDWLDGQGLEYWHELRPAHLQEYRASLNGKAADTVRLYFVPIRRTARWVAMQWPNHYRDISAGFRLAKRKSRTRRYDGGAGVRSLTVADVLELVCYLKVNAPALALGAGLQGLAGLQLQEALRLTWDKVDLGAGTITIEGEVKNEHRVRCIPVCQLLVRMLSQTKGKGAVVRYDRRDSYSKAMRREMLRWDTERTVPPKDLRNVIQSTAVIGGWYGYYVQRYVGHAPSTIGERHYVEGRGNVLMEQFRQKVLANLEKLIPDDAVTGY